MCSYTITAGSNVAKLGANSFDRSKWQQKYDYEIWGNMLDFDKVFISFPLG